MRIVYSRIRAQDTIFNVGQVSKQLVLGPLTPITLLIEDDSYMASSSVNRRFVIEELTRTFETFR